MQHKCGVCICECVYVCVCEYVYVRDSRRDDGSVCNISVCLCGVCICECGYVRDVIAGGTTVLCAT